MIKVPSPITPAGAFPVTEDIYIKGGIRVVANLSALAALTTAQAYTLENGALAITADTGELHKCVFLTTGQPSWIPYVLSLNNMPVIDAAHLASNATAMYKLVASLAVLNAIPTATIMDGTLARTLDTNTFYEYHSKLQAWKAYVSNAVNLPSIPLSKIVGAASTGFQVVATPALLASIATANLIHGTLALVASTGILYELDTSVTPTAWNTFYLALDNIPQIPVTKLESSGTPSFTGILSIDTVANLMTAVTTSVPDGALGYVTADSSFWRFDKASSTWSRILNF